MLVLSRKKSESILVGNDIRITVLDAEGERVSIGVDAPRNIVILREELVQETRNLNIQSIKRDTIRNLTQMNRRRD